MNDSNLTGDSILQDLNETEQSRGEASANFASKHKTEGFLSGATDGGDSTNWRKRAGGKAREFLSSMRLRKRQVEDPKSKVVDESKPAINITHTEALVENRTNGEVTDNTVIPIEIPSRRVDDAYSSEVREKIHKAALARLVARDEEYADDVSLNATKGSTMRCEKFSSEDNEFVVLKPYKATKDNDFEERAFPLERLTSAGPIPEGLEFPVIIDRENQIIVNECASGKYPMDLTAEEIRAITDEQLEIAASAIEYADSLGLQFDHKPDNLFVDRDKGITIIDLARKKNANLTAEQEFLYIFLQGLLTTPSSDYDGLMARQELEAKARRIAQRRWHPENVDS